MYQMDSLFQELIAIPKNIGLQQLRNFQFFDLERERKWKKKEKKKKKKPNGIKHENLKMCVQKCTKKWKS